MVGSYKSVGRPAEADQHVKVLDGELLDTFSGATNEGGGPNRRAWWGRIGGVSKGSTVADDVFHPLCSRVAPTVGREQRA